MRKLRQNTVTSKKQRVNKRKYFLNQFCLPTLLLLTNTNLIYWVIS
jgi:hypothetical protein